MVFTSPLFLFVFFPLSIAGYYLCIFSEKHIRFFKKIRIADLLLTAVSLIFYGWACFDDIFKLPILVISLFAFARLIQHYKTKKNVAASRIILIIGIVILTAILIYFKYFSFLLDTVTSVIGTEISFDRAIIAPLGISFLIFTGISYIVDVWRGTSAGNLLDAALYLTFFPKIVSGPIVLWRDFGCHISERKETSALFMKGLNKFIIGFAKKLILADTFGILAAEIQNNTQTGIDIPTAWGCTFIYMLQIYFDFSGYSDAAIGLGNMFGFDIKKNFDLPYVSTSISEFWRRWHISLGSWFRQYIYFPLGGSRCSLFKTLFNLGVVFLLTGIWHSAGWGYIGWGIAHGLCCIIERCIKDTKLYIKTPKIIKWFFTMFIVMVGWQIFRLGSLGKVIDFTKIMLGMTQFDTIYLSFTYFFDFRIIVLIVAAVISALLPALPIYQKIAVKFETSPSLYMIREIILILLMVLSVLFMVNSTYSPFIYFQY